MSESTGLQRAAVLGAWLSWMGIIFFFSTQAWSGHVTESTLDNLLTTYLPPIRAQLTHTDLDLLNFTVRKLAHFTEYAILITLGYRAWRALNQSPLAALRYALTLSVLFAISDEFHQLFVPGRTSMFTDVLIDSLGASFAALLLLKFFMHPQSS